MCRIVWDILVTAGSSGPAFEGTPCVLLSTCRFAQGGLVFLKWKAQEVSKSSQSILAARSSKLDSMLVTSVFLEATTVLLVDKYPHIHSPNTNQTKTLQYLPRFYHHITFCRNLSDGRLSARSWRPMNQLCGILGGSKSWDRRQPVWPSRFIRQGKVDDHIASFLAQKNDQIDYFSRTFSDSRSIWSIGDITGHTTNGSLFWSLCELQSPRLDWVRCLLFSFYSTGVLKSRADYIIPKLDAHVSKHQSNLQFTLGPVLRILNMHISAK